MNRTYEKIRERALDIVDQRHGYTLEFAPCQETHKREYEEEYERLVKVAADDPGILICSHEPRHHYLGGGIKVCFECMARMLV